MAGIWNVNSVNDINAKKILRKLSFNVGENFAARVINSDKLTGEVLLKLLDGWQFSAELQNPMDILPEGLLRFQVEGFEDGKLQLKLINVNDKEQSSERKTLDFLLKEKGITVNKEDYSLLSKMVKHEIPLTKENISKIKTIVDFQNKIKLNYEEEDLFISRYMQSKGIEPSGKEGTKIANTLKSFFNQLKSISEDDIITLLENGIELTEENIKSFNDIFKGSSSIYKDIREFKENVTTLINNKEVEHTGKLNVQLSIEESSLLEDGAELTEENIKSFNDISKGSSSIYKGIREFKENVTTLINNREVEHTGKLNVQLNIEESNLPASEGASNIEINEEQKLALNSTENDKVKRLTNSNEKPDQVSKMVAEDSEKDGIALNKMIKKEYSIDDIAKNIKEQISTKTEEMKTVIRAVLEQKGELKPEAYNNLIQVLDKSINDFKVYNTISNQYYYMDLPINLENYEYQCKLMIKDERKKGKRIDSTDVKIAASVNTIHMGTIDAYIKVKNYNMDVELKCDELWTKVLDLGKEKISSDLSNMGYNVYIRVDERQEDMNITSCRDFFEDVNLGRINTKV
ncbi:hypothetical protein P8V03_05910 [Clostridium sp. A1-XYC3]|uniref:Flagellar hook-length control protein FliK n=1 Tax=Clostridium tanneri TaxID=3037988 RepID=A0ABU4JRG6_9CLOT|nr:hypothetical protein [Clostridium sp. A1-XYC3]MDW8800686.1 hypothetical protein [Clostridium sp. A1-XYC3]